MKIPLSEYTKTNSIYSSMRLAFLWAVKFWIILTSFVAISFVGISITNSFIEKKIEIPISAMVGLVVSIGGVAFGGKAIQSFSEPNDPPVDTTSTDK